ncbi:MAG: DNA-processing protein DprA [Alphaproteobacteria bacterium]|nr:DNA-processing protein DprA [Alphaproteobacteria bacterium]
MNKTSLIESERLNWIRLSRTEQVGPITFRQLLRRYGSASEALIHLGDLSRRGGRAKPLIAASLASVEKELKACDKLGARLILSCEPDYPEALAAIEDAPPVLAVLGTANLLHKKQIGIVGARNASLNGRKMSERLAHDLGKLGFVITSGLARGIDTAAHTQAIPTGTVAVLAGGVDVIYPEENRSLYQKIIETGCIVSDQYIGCEPRANLFPRRNRLISGLSLGVIVVEAARRSGSLITARMALEQGREVFAVPGSPLDPRANGTNDLIRQGAILTESTADILEHIHKPKQLFAEAPPIPYNEPPMQVDEAFLEQSREKIIENLSTSPVSVDELVRQCQLSLPLVLTVLLELELAGRLDRQPGHKVALIG